MHGGFRTARPPHQCFFLPSSDSSTRSAFSTMRGMLASSHCRNIGRSSSTTVSSIVRTGAPGEPATGLDAGATCCATGACADGAGDTRAEICAAGAGPEEGDGIDGFNTGVAGGRCCAMGGPVITMSSFAAPLLDCGDAAALRAPTEPFAVVAVVGVAGNSTDGWDDLAAVGSMRAAPLDSGRAAGEARTWVWGTASPIRGNSA